MISWNVSRLFSPANIIFCCHSLWWGIFADERLRLSTHLSREIQPSQLRYRSPTMAVIYHQIRLINHEIKWHFGHTVGTPYVAYALMSLHRMRLGLICHTPIQVCQWLNVLQTQDLWTRNAGEVLPVPRPGPDYLEVPRTVTMSARKVPFTSCWLAI